MYHLREIIKLPHQILQGMFEPQLLVMSRLSACIVAPFGLSLTVSNSPFGLIGGLAGLSQFGGGGGETLLGPLQVLFQQLDASVEGRHFRLGLVNKI